MPRRAAPGARRGSGPDPGSSRWPGIRWYRSRSGPRHGPDRFRPPTPARGHVADGFAEGHPDQSVTLGRPEAGGTGLAGRRPVGMGGHPYTAPVRLVLQTMVGAHDRPSRICPSDSFAPRCGQRSSHASTPPGERHSRRSSSSSRAVPGCPLTTSPVRATACQSSSSVRSSITTPRPRRGYWGSLPSTPCTYQSMR